ncbi:MAG: beta-ketoacyl synthase chain length factor [Candidatus Omnitrophota bacterium]
MGPMNIAGIGVLCSQGRGLARFEQALNGSGIPPKVSGSCHRIPPEALEDREVLWDIRRADRFSKIAVLAAHDAIRDGGASNGAMGVILCTGLGPHATTFRFLDDILDYGDSSVSPTTFSHSIHNAAASYIAKVLKCTGPTLTVTQFDFAFQEALLLAGAWMAEGRCERVLVGCVEECGQVFESIYSQSSQASACGSKTSVGPGEGGVFFLVTSDPAHRKYGVISDVSFNAEDGVEECPDMRIIENDVTVAPGIPVADFSPIFGSMMTGSGSQCVAAALMLRNQRAYASGAIAETNPMEIREIHCIKYDCNQQKCCVKLKK